MVARTDARLPLRQFACETDETLAKCSFRMCSVRARSQALRRPLDPRRRSIQEQGVSLLKNRSQAIFWTVASLIC